MNFKDGNGPDFTYISIVKGSDGECGPDGVGIVIGALWEDRCAHRFTKEGVAELITFLQKLHDEMED